MAGIGRLIVGYTVELWAVSPGDVLAALAAADPAPPPAPMPEATREAWPVLATAVAGALQRGGGRLVAEYANYVAAVVRSVGFPYGALAHTSSGGDEFRRRFLAGPAAARYGHERVARLVVRDLGGLQWEEIPRLGHLTADEVAAAAAEVEAACPPEVAGHPEDTGPLLELDSVLLGAARHGLEVHDIYG